MKKKIAAFLSLFIVLCVVFTAAGGAAYAAKASEPAELSFNEDGKFVILQFADCQDAIFPKKIMLRLMEKACAELGADLVIFTGDNCSQFWPLTSIAIRQLLKPIREQGIPFAYTLGNHDPEGWNKKESLHKAYMKAGYCLTYNADPEIQGFGNCNLPIMSRDGSKMAFNLWFFDSNQYRSEGGYDIVYPDQVEWYRKKSEAIEAAEGGKVPSLAFQHIIVPEVFDYFEPAPEGTGEEVKFQQSHNQGFLKKFRADAPLLPGYSYNLGEFPCPPSVATNQLTVIAERGDVLGMVFGHDHTNDFIIKTEAGVDIIQSPGISQTSYGDDAIRGFRMIILDESSPWTYETRTYTYHDFFTKEEIIKGNRFIGRLFNPVRG